MALGLVWRGAKQLRELYHAACISGARAGKLTPQPPRQRLNEAVAIGLVVIDMGRDAHAAKTRRDADAVSGRSLDEPFCHSILEANVGEANVLS
jgi:hypothetical protein